LNQLVKGGSIALLFAAAKTKAAEHWFGRSGNKSRDTLNEAHVLFDFFFLPFFFFVAITLLLDI
jgi:hypothetical protein